MKGYVYKPPVECEICGEEIEGVTVHFFNHDGEHLFHITCHDKFMQERGIGITDIYIHEEGSDG